MFLKYHGSNLAKIATCIDAAALPCIWMDGICLVFSLPLPLSLSPSISFYAPLTASFPPSPAWSDPGLGIVEEAKVEFPSAPHVDKMVVHIT
jgi:hypothetical protein